MMAAATTALSSSGGAIFARRDIMYAIPRDCLSRHRNHA